MIREAMLFYQSFDKAIDKLEDVDRLSLYTAITKYGLYGEEPELDGAAGAMFELVRPQIDANNRRYQNGKKGGAPKDNQNATKNKPDTTEKQPKNNQKQPKNNQKQAKEKDKEKEKDKDKDINTNSAPSRAQIELIFEHLWKMYPEKKGKARVSYADKRKLADIGEEKIQDAIERYKKEVSAIGWKHFQNGSTFFHSGYVDYLEENYVPTAEKTNRPPERDYNMDELELRLLASN